MDFNLIWNKNVTNHNRLRDYFKESNLTLIQVVCLKDIYERKTKIDDISKLKDGRRIFMNHFSCIKNILSPFRYN